MNDLALLLKQHETALAVRPTLKHLDYVLVDGSASMRDKWWNFLTAAQVMLDDIKKSGLESRLIVHTFDTTDIKLVQRDGPLADAASLIDDPIGAHFTGTPLYDAISVMGLELQKLMPESASILIVTDGDDLDSKTTPIQARAVLDWLRANGWQVSFIGCDFNNEAQTKALGVTEYNAIGVAKAHLNDAAKAFAAKRIRYGQTGEQIGFSDAEKKQFGGYLAAPAK